MMKEFVGSSSTRVSVTEGGVPVVKFYPSLSFQESERKIFYALDTSN